MMENTVQKIMEAEGFKELTPIQKEVISRKNKNRDLIALSSTGSGKSHAFFMAMFDKIDPDKEEVQVIVSTPTRELAYQLYDRCRKLADLFGVKVRLCTGGTERQTAGSNAQIIIGTPGRMKDLFVDQSILRMDTAKLVIVDEADMTLEFGFLEDVDQILSKMDTKVQLMVFSATMPTALEPFIRKYLYDPQLIQIEDSETYQSHVSHVLVPCKHLTYGEKLLEVLKGINPYICLIFANTNTAAHETAELMRQNGYDLIELHGDLESRQRQQALKAIQSQKKSYIVASDIASRGIDLEGITHVVSLGFPSDLSYYIHRSGRTGRAGRHGTCYALYQNSDQNAIRSLIKQGIRFEQKDIKRGQWISLKPFDHVRRKKNDPLEQEIRKVVAARPKKVKPNYKKKEKQEIEKLRRKRKREIIRNDIRRQQKERAKAAQRKKRTGE